MTIAQPATISSVSARARSVLCQMGWRSILPKAVLLFRNLDFVFQHGLLPMSSDGESVHDVVALYAFFDAAVNQRLWDESVLQQLAWTPGRIKEKDEELAQHEKVISRINSIYLLWRESPWTNSEQDMEVIHRHYIEELSVAFDREELAQELWGKCLPYLDDAPGNLVGDVEALKVAMRVCLDKDGHVIIDGKRDPEPDLEFIVAQMVKSLRPVYGADDIRVRLEEAVLYQTSSDGGSERGSLESIDEGSEMSFVGKPLTGRNRRIYFPSF